VTSRGPVGPEPEALVRDRSCHASVATCSAQVTTLLSNDRRPGCARTNCRSAAQNIAPERHAHHASARTYRHFCVRGCDRIVQSVRVLRKRPELVERVPDPNVIAKRVG
jgi:hypothetical protein